MVSVMPIARSAQQTLRVSAHSVAIAGSSEPWIKLLPAGKLPTRDGRAFDAGDQAQLAEIAALTRQYHGTTEMVVDYEHQTINTTKNGQPAPAAGWIKEIQVRPDGIYGRVEWTAAAQKAIEAGEYRYLSPVFFHTAEGRVLALQMAALTNTPNLQMAEVSAHAVAFFQTTPENVQEDRMDKEKLRKLLGLSETASDGDIEIAINSALAAKSALAKAAGKPETTPVAELATALTAAMTAARNPDPAQFVPIAQVTALQTSLKELQERLDTGDAETAVNTAIKDGKIIPAMKDWAVSLHKSDPKAFAAFVGAAPTLTRSQIDPAKPKPKGGKDTNTVDLSDTQLAACKAIGLSPAAYAKTLAAEVAEGEDA